MEATMNRMCCWLGATTPVPSLVLRVLGFHCSFIVPQGLCYNCWTGVHALVEHDKAWDLWDIVKLSLNHMVLPTICPLGIFQIR